MTDAAQLHLQIGDRVLVRRPLPAGPKHAFDGRTGTVLAFTKPHGFVRVYLDGDPDASWAVLVHPESLVVILGGQLVALEQKTISGSW